MAFPKLLSSEEKRREREATLEPRSVPLTKINGVIWNRMTERRQEGGTIDGDELRRVARGGLDACEPAAAALDGRDGGGDCAVVRRCDRTARGRRGRCLRRARAPPAGQPPSDTQREPLPHLQKGRMEVGSVCEVRGLSDFSDRRRRKLRSERGGSGTGAWSRVNCRGIAPRGGARCGARARGRVLRAIAVH